MMIKAFIRKIIRKVSKNKPIYKLAQRIAFDHRGENNADIHTNGEMLFLKKNINFMDVFFDVGANVGEWTNVVLKMKPRAKVFSFEPIDDSFNELIRNVQSENARPIKMALGDKNQKIAFNVYGDHSVMNSVYGRANDGLAVLKKQEVNMMKLDDFCLENNVKNIDFLKIDVEGNELKVLEGVENMLSGSKIGVIQFEYGGTYIDAGILLKDIFDFFSGRSYGIYKILPDKILRVNYDQKLENFQYANYLAINNSWLNKINL